MRARFGFAWAAVAIISAGCAVGPNYKRPAIDTPQAFRGASQPESAETSVASLGDQQWWNVFQDQQLQALIRTALQQNYDLRIAAARVAQAQAQVTITHSAEFPGAEGAAASNSSRSASSVFFGPVETSNTELGLGFQWNIDFWGKYRRATESARDQLLASDWAKKQVTSTLVANLASAYFTLRDLDLQLQISQQTLLSDQDSLRLTQLLVDHGRTSLLDVRQAEQLVFNASGSIEELQKQIAEQENLIRILLGQNPGDVARGLELTAQPHPPGIPAGLPSSLLERRPDIRAAEADLMSANAEIGVAKAAYFPSISLTGEGGFQSIALTKLFTSPAGFWTAAAQATQPLYTGGELRGNVRLAQARSEEAALSYQQTVQQAFQQVSNALVAYGKDQEFRKQQDLLTQSAQDASRLSDLRYRSGAASYLEVLDANTRYYSAELTLAEAQLAEMLDYVELYRALGGGWQQ